MISADLLKPRRTQRRVVPGPRSGLTTRSVWQWMIYQRQRGGHSRRNSRRRWPRREGGSSHVSKNIRGASTSVNTGFPAHTTPTDPNSNFQQPYYQTMAHGPNIPPTGMVFLTVLFPIYFSLGHQLTLLLTRG
jgi:hypothetical protein